MKIILAVLIILLLFYAEVYAQKNLLIKGNNFALIQATLLDSDYNPNSRIPVFVKFLDELLADRDTLINTSHTVTAKESINFLSKIFHTKAFDNISYISFMIFDFHEDISHLISDPISAPYFNHPISLFEIGLK